nr:uncharacterized protein LOC121124595 [Lepeophtheirus salmonis]XP_040575687.1 uncharacterized protein LOC121124595 [Lepeophtheirus salmonis]
MKTHMIRQFSSLITFVHTMSGILQCNSQDVNENNCQYLRRGQKISNFIYSGNISICTRDFGYSCEVRVEKNGIRTFKNCEDCLIRECLSPFTHSCSTSIFYKGDTFWPFQDNAFCRKKGTQYIGTSCSCKSSQRVLKTPAVACDKTTEGIPCKFPFKYKGVTYSSCANVAHTTVWCATSYYKGGNIAHSWGNCDPTCQNQSNIETPRVCKTQKGTNCRIPFKYYGRTFNGCTKYKNGNYYCLEENSGAIEICNDDCQKTNSKWT